MGQPADAHRAENRMAAVALLLAAPPSRIDPGQQHVNHVLLEVATTDRATVAELSPPAASPTSAERRTEDKVVPEDRSKPDATRLPWHDGVPHEITIEEDRLEVLIETERQRVEETQEVPRGNEEQPCIWRVHPSLREKENEDYEPKLVSIGPFHRGKDSLLPMEEIKLRYLNNLISRSPAKNKLSNYLRVVRDCEARARKQYAEEVKLNADEFVKMLVLDGCFIIEYFLKRVFEETQQTAQLSGVRWGFSHLRRDLMLLENQIPFFVLVSLFDESTIPITGTSEAPPTLMQLALGFLEIDRLPGELQPPVDEVHHLLHLHHWCLEPTRVRDEHNQGSRGRWVLYPLKMATRLISVLFFALLYLVLVRKWPRCCFPTRETETGVLRTIPCAIELHQSGVKFRKKDKVNSYLKVSFTDGTLEIPFLPIQETTSSKLRNFIALEQCCPQVGNHFTSYAIFMDNIINTDGDVAILRQRGIIESKLGSDREVAKMFNALCKGTHLDYEKHYNADLFKHVKEYGEVPHHRWRASLKSTHFSSPWTAISLLTAMLIFGLAITQAFFNISRRRR